MLKEIFEIYLFYLRVGELREEVYFLPRNGEFPPVQIVEQRGLLGDFEGKSQPVGAQRLVLVALGFVIAVDTVFSVAEQGVPDVCHVSAYLVSSSRHKLNLNKTAVLS